MKISNFPTFHFFRKIFDFPLTFPNFQSLHNSIDFSINFWLNLIFLNKIEENCFVENLLFTDENHSIIDVEEKKYNFYEIAGAHDWNFERRFFVGRVEVGIWTIFRGKLGIRSGNSKNLWFFSINWIKWVIWEIHNEKLVNFPRNFPRIIWG